MIERMVLVVRAIVGYITRFVPSRIPCNPYGYCTLTTSTLRSILIVNELTNCE